MVRAWLFLAGAACLLSAAYAAGQPQECKLPPAWKAHGVDPMAEVRKGGNMTVVALLKASCSYSTVQATLLQRMKKKLERKGITGITYLIVNMKGTENQKYRLDRLVDFKVYQDKKGDIWKALGGGKDDFFVYDRCGELGYYLDYSITYLGWPHVQNAILYTHQNKHGCTAICPKGQVNPTKGNIASKDNKPS